ncbi:MAG: sugar transporter [Phenylobacterium zucineum]|nr:MAG: sugar transporter [Phenylobacterium zucineum]
MTTVEAASAGPKLSFWTKASYGFGAVAVGVRDNGLAYFLLLFYSQVMGLDARLAGLALTLGLVVDAFLDPIIGYVSDNFHSGWGRRHPFIYISIIPIALIYFMIWSPPTGMSQSEMFWWLLVTMGAIRLFYSLFEIPFAALAPELTKDYDERTVLQSFTLFFGWFVGNFMSVFNFWLFGLFVTATIKDGRFNPEAYHVYGLVASAIMVVAITVTAVGTHRHIPNLSQPPEPVNKSLGEIFREIYETLVDKSFFSLFLSTLFGSIAGGLSAAMAFINYTYFWAFTSAQSGLMVTGVFISAFIGAGLAPIVSRTIGKKRGAIIIGLVAFLGSPCLMVLRLFNLLPPNGSPVLFWTFFVVNVFDVGLIICYQTLVPSMMADLVEHAEVRTGRRSEGIFYAAAGFIRKLVAGGGVLLAGFIMAAAGLQKGADPTSVSADTVWKLGAYYAPTIVILWMLMLVVLSTYTISREGHEENLRTIARNKMAKEG